MIVWFVSEKVSNLFPRLDFVIFFVSKGFPRENFVIFCFHSVFNLFPKVEIFQMLFSPCLVCGGGAFHMLAVWLLPCHAVLLHLKMMNVLVPAAWWHLCFSAYLVLVWSSLYHQPDAINFPSTWCQCYLFFSINLVPSVFSFQPGAMPSGYVSMIPCGFFLPTWYKCQLFPPPINLVPYFLVTPEQVPSVAVLNLVPCHLLFPSTWCHLGSINLVAVICGTFHQPGAICFFIATWCHAIWLC